MKQQIVIIGAGPAGITTALYLAKKGIGSLVVDKSRFPRHKACGDNISGNVLRILNELDASWLGKMSEGQLALSINGLTAYAPNGHHFDVDFLPLEKDTDQPSCYTIPRIDFDHFLFQRAKESPYITLMEDCDIASVERLKTGGVQLRSRSGDVVIETELVVFSVGSNSNLMNDLYPVPKNPKHVGVGVRAYFEGVKPAGKPNFCEIIITQKLLPGGIYITPFPNGTVNVNVVMRSDVVKREKINLTDLMMQVLEEHPVLKERFEAAKMIGKPQGSSLFLGTQKRRLSGDHFLFVGDAAGLIDLLSANGIPQAMLSAKIAAEEISRCVLQNNFSAAALAPYDVRLYKRIEHYLKLSQLVTPFMGNRLFLKLMVLAMNYLAKKFSKNEVLRDFIYEKNIVSKLIKPTFYYKLFFGVKNAEALSISPLSRQSGG